MNMNASDCFISTGKCDEWSGRKEEKRKKNFQKPNND